jgi:hypothetical protein
MGGQYGKVLARSHRVTACAPYPANALTRALRLHVPVLRYLLSCVVIPVQCGHDAVNFGSRTTFILAPQDGQSKTVDAALRRFTFSTTSGFVRAWLKLWRTSNGSMLSFPTCFPTPNRKKVSRPRPPPPCHRNHPTSLRGSATRVRLRAASSHAVRGVPLATFRAAADRTRPFFGNGVI